MSYNALISAYERASNACQSEEEEAQVLQKGFAIYKEMQDKVRVLLQNACVHA